MSDQAYIDSYYSATLSHGAPRARLREDLETETCVIGGGLAGLTTARELARRGHHVVLLEARRLGWGASGRNGGSVSPGFAQGLTALEQRLGKDRARKLHALSAAGATYIEATITEAGADNIIEGRGSLRLIRHGDVTGLRATRDRLEANYGEEVAFWDGERVRACLRTSIYTAGLHYPRGFQIHTLRYVLALAALAENDGVRLYENTPALALRRDGAGWQAETAETKITARQVVLATSAYGVGQALYPRLERALLPIATYIVASEPIGPDLHEIIGFDGSLGDSRRASDYYRKVAGDRLLWGGRITTRRSQPARLGDLLRRDIAKVYPDLAGLRIAQAWAGLMGYAIHKMPILGELETGLWAATAFGGHGLNTSSIAGELIARAIAEKDDTWRLFQPFGPRWAGGPLGRVATQLEYWRLQALDRWDERRAAGLPAAARGIE
jgi:glycine/D-amino acid oxidase-like deaminating enzyme